MSDTTLPPGGNTPPTLPPAPTLPGGTPPATPPAPAPAPAPSEDFTKAVAALAAALGKQPDGTGAPPAEPTPAPSGDDLNSLNISNIQNPVIRSMAQVMQTAGKGLDMNRVFSKAIQTGDAELLDVAYIKDKAGANADQLITIAQGIVQAVQADIDKAVGAVHTMAGGEANWNASVAAFNEKAPQELRSVIGQMMNSGNSAQIDAAGKLVIQFAQGNGFVPNQQPLVQQGGASLPSSQALSKDEFQTELRKLDQNSATYLQDRASLFTRRTLGKKLGK